MPRRSIVSRLAASSAGLEAIGPSSLSASTSRRWRRGEPRHFRCTSALQHTPHECPCLVRSRRRIAPGCSRTSELMRGGERGGSRHLTRFGGHRSSFAGVLCPRGAMRCRASDTFSGISILRIDRRRPTRPQESPRSFPQAPREGKSCLKTGGAFHPRGARPSSCPHCFGQSPGVAGWTLVSPFFVRAALPLRPRVTTASSIGTSALSSPGHACAYGTNAQGHEARTGRERTCRARLRPLTRLRV